MGKKDIAKNTIFLLIPSVLKFLIGLVRAKIVAIFLGTEGTGVINQLQNILNSIASFTTSGMPDGMVKQLAKANSKDASKQEIASIIKTYGTIVLITTIIAYILGFSFSASLTKFVFGDQKYFLYYLIGFSALPIMILSSSSYAIIKAYKQIKSLMWSEITITITTFLLFFIMVYFFRLTGAVIYVTLSFFVSWLAYRYVSERIIKNALGLRLKDIIGAQFINNNFKELLSFSGVFFTSGALDIIVNLLTRNLIIRNVGINAIGMYSPVTAWAGLFTGFLLPSIFTYLFPRISESKTNEEINQLLNDIIRLLSFVTIPFVAFSITFRDILIPMFYSKEFSEAGKYLPFHFVAIYLLIIIYTFAQVFAPTGRLKQFVPIIILNNVITLVIVYSMIPRFGLWGWVANFTITPFISAIIYYVFWHKTIGFSFKKENIVLILFIIISSGLLLTFRNNFIISIFITVTIFATSFLMLKKSERLFFKNLLFKCFSPLIHRTKF